MQGSVVPTRSRRGSSLGTLRNPSKQQLIPRRLGIYWVDTNSVEGVVGGEDTQYYSSPPTGSGKDYPTPAR